MRRRHRRRLLTPQRHRKRAHNFAHLLVCVLTFRRSPEQRQIAWSAGRFLVGVRVLVPQEANKQGVRTRTEIMFALSWLTVA